MEKIGKKKEIKTPFFFGNESMPPTPFTSS